MRRLFCGIGYGLSAIAFAILLLAGVTARSGDPSLWPAKPDEPVTEIFVVSHGYHAGIALSTAQVAAAVRRSGNTALGLVADVLGAPASLAISALALIVIGLLFARLAPETHRAARATKHR